MGLFAWLSVVVKPYTPAVGAKAQRAAPQGTVKEYEAEQFEAILGNLGHFGDMGFVLNEAACRCGSRGLWSWGMSPLRNANKTPRSHR